MAFDLSTAKPVAQQAGGFDLSTAQPVQDTPFQVESVTEPIRAISSGIGHAIVGGLAGAGEAIFDKGVSIATGKPFSPEQAAETVKDIQANAFQPQTEGGKEVMLKIGELAKQGVDFTNVSIGKLVALGQMLIGQDVSESEVVAEVKKKGISAFLGDATLEATGSPEAAALAFTAPTAVGEVFGLKGAGTGVKAGVKAGARAAEQVTGAADKAVALTGELITGAEKAGGQLVKDISRFQTPATREIARQLKAGDINTDVALFKLEGEGVTSPTARQQLLGADLPKVVKDTPAIKAARQGFDEEFLEVVKKAGTRADKNALIKMTNIAKKGRTNPVFRDETRPSFVAGDILLDKVNAIKGINRAAGKQIGNATKFLKGGQVPVAQIGDKFLTSLEQLKITVKPDGKLDFKDALISGAGRKKAIVDIFDRMSRNKNPDALDLHELKQFIDETVSYGKTVRGLGGKAENALKALRTNIKETLDSNFPQYAKANEAYSDTIGLLDKIQDLAGKKTDLTSDSASGDLAILARRITSNAQSRGRVRDSFLDLDKLLDKHAGFSGVKRLAGKGDGKVDFNLLMKYADELDKVGGSAATTSFTGGIETAIKASRGVKEFLSDKAIEAARKALKINVKGAHDSMGEFLKSELRNNRQK